LLVLRAPLRCISTSVALSPTASTASRICSGVASSLAAQRAVACSSERSMRSG
jgi:hypothetical protein